MTYHWPTHPEAPLPDDVHALIFDCDGTLVDTMPTHYVAWCDTLKTVGLTLTEDRFYALAGVTTRRIIEILSQEQNIACDPDALAHLKEEMYISRLASLEPIHSVVDIARRERQLGRRKLAVASGGWKRIVLASLQSIGADNLFDTIVGADDVEHGKPAPDVFLEAARRLNVPPSNCLVYEDGELGFQAARNAHMRVIDVRPWYLPRKHKAG